MGKALFLALSAAIFTAYALVANALLIPAETLTPISGEFDCVTQGTGDDEECIDDDPRTNIPILGPIIEAAASSISVGFNLFGAFFQLLTFQAPGLEAASLITAMIFVPLGFANAFIVFSAIRGSS